jgi:hypothetical protein
MKSIKPSKGVRNTQFDAYSVSREFYSPKYEYEASSKDKDYRRTLYWNPFVTTGKTGKAGVSFYNNASAKGFEVQAETITNDGKVGVYESQH